MLVEPDRASVGVHALAEHSEARGRTTQRTIAYFPLRETTFQNVHITGAEDTKRPPDAGRTTSRQMNYVTLSSRQKQRTCTRQGARNTPPKALGVIHDDMVSVADAQTLPNSF